MSQSSQQRAMNHSLDGSARMTEEECKEYDRGHCYTCVLYESYDEGPGYANAEICSGIFDPELNREGKCPGWFDEDVWQREWGVYPSIKNRETGQVLTWKEYTKIQSSRQKGDKDE